MLIKLTKKREISWTVATSSAEKRVLEAVFAGRTLQLEEVPPPKIYYDFGGGRPRPTTQYKLSLVGNSDFPLYRVPMSDKIPDLMAAAKEQLADVRSFLDDLEEAAAKV
jgi:hypothetical protein